MMKNIEYINDEYHWGTYKRNNFFFIKDFNFYFFN